MRQAVSKRGSKSYVYPRHITARKCPVKAREASRQRQAPFRLSLALISHLSFPHRIAETSQSETADGE